MQILHCSTVDAVQAIISHSDGLISEPEIIAYLEPFMKEGSITPVEDPSGNELIARLTPSASFLPSATIEAIESFICICRQISDASMDLMRTTERVLKSAVSNVFADCSRSSQWHNRSGFFYRRERSANYFDDFQTLLRSKSTRYGNANDASSSEMIVWMLSFTDLSKTFYWVGDALYCAKVEVSKCFGISKPDVLSYGLRSISENVRNLDAHLKPSYRISNDKPFSDKSRLAMLNPWISTKCNLGRFYGRMCFLVYITTTFTDRRSQDARREIKSLIQQLPKMTLNYMGVQSGWVNEPLWSNI